VAADDGVMPQTVEAIRFARSANARIVVAINKMDKEGANPDMVKAQLASEHQLNPEEWGGDTIMVPISAKMNEGIDRLLDMVLLVADMEELKADTDVPAEGLVIEAHMEKGKGSVVNLLVEQGMLKPGHFLVAGTAYGKVRTLVDFAGKTLKEAGPSTPVTVTGFKELPQFGDVFTIVKNEKEARLMVERTKIEAERNAASTNVTGADILKMMTQKHDTQDLNVIVKADVQGSLTSVMDSLRLVDTKGQITLRIIGSGVGNVNESDVRLAESSDAIIYGFNIELPPAVKRLAMRDKVQIRLYRVIYELLDDARQSMEQMLAPEVVETEVGKLTVKGVFRTMKEEVICGGEVTSGKVMPNVLARVLRGGEQIAEVEVTNVQRQQQEAKEVFEGEMCGLSLKTVKKLIVEEGDKLEFIAQKATELGASAIWAFPADWSVAKWDGKKLAKKSEKLEKIAQGAAEQSKRNLIPEVRLFDKKADFQAALADFDRIIAAYEESAKEGETAALVRALSGLESGAKVLFIFGPEGGLSPDEIDAFGQAGAISAGLGPRILRAETAPLYALTAVSVLLELSKDSL